MSDKLRIDLKGQNTERFSEIVNDLSKTLESLLSNPEATGTFITNKKCRNILSSVGDIVKSFFGAKLDHQSIENAKKLAEIAEIYDKLNKASIEQEIIVIERDIKKIHLEKERIELQKMHVIESLNEMDLKSKYIEQPQDGTIKIILTNDNFPESESEVPVSEA